MHRHRFLFAPVIGMLVVGLIVVAAFAMVSNARLQGFMLGQMAAGGSEGMMMPFAMYGMGSFGLIKPLLCLGGLFLIGGFFLLPLLMMAKFCRAKAWQKMNGKKDEEWCEHAPEWVKMHPFFGHFRRGHTPPWQYDRETETGATEQPPDKEPR
ncbi:MAG: hypothetical protein JXA42_07195 [Anaerolineales bacterium]|nr:hypothetical protein [Anaerolineales bacterium]